MGTAQDRAKAGEQLTGAKRLGNIIVGTQFEPDHAVGFVALRGQHHDRYGALGTDPLTDFQAVHPRHHHIQKHCVIGRGLERGQSPSAVGRMHERYPILA